MELQIPVDYCVYYFNQTSVQMAFKTVYFLLLGKSAAGRRKLSELNGNSLFNMKIYCYTMQVEDFIVKETITARHLWAHHPLTSLELSKSH